MTNKLEIGDINRIRIYLERKGASVQQIHDTSTEAQLQADVYLLHRPQTVTSDHWFFNKKIAVRLFTCDNS